MRVLYWSELYQPYVGGVEVVARARLPALGQRGFAMSVITSHAHLDLPDQEVLDGISIYRFPFADALADTSPRRIMALQQQVVYLKRQIRPHLVHLSLTGPSVYFHLQTLTAYPAPTVLSVHLGIGHQPAGAQTLLGKALRTAAWIVAPSAATLAEVWQLAPETRARSSVILNALALPPLEPSPLPRNDPIILCLGRAVPEKGFDVALTAFARLRHRFARPRLIIAGEGPALATLKEQAITLGVAQSVDFTGLVPPEKVPELINGAAMVVVPSRWREAFGLVALQAAQMARPVVATRTGGLPEVVADGETGILVEVDDTAALARAMEALLADYALATRMGQRGRQRALTLFSWERYLADYEKLYQFAGNAATSPLEEIG